ncbi:MaoC/PaaZ C-terminal domain-containing protein [Stappia sp.]|uniref:MaoC family dehydratase n=1 Tax=Stappia sp. TaxID=1870903 RepID=UPI0032D933E8
MREPQPDVGTLLPAAPFEPLDAAQVTAYAEASGDRNPIHLDDARARAAGLPGRIVHGMLIMGQFEAALRAWRPEARILTLQTRFLKPLAVGTAVAVRGRIAKVEADRIIVRLSVQDGDGATYCIGDATVAA